MQRGVCNVRCIAMHHDTKTTWSFHGVASLRGSTACNAFAGVQRGETRIAGGREGEKKRRTDGRKSFIECGRTAFGVAKHNYLGNVAYSSIFRVSSSWTVRSYNSPWHRTEVGDLLQWRVRANRSRRGEVSDRAVPRLLTTPNRFRFEHDSYIKG